MFKNIVLVLGVAAALSSCQTEAPKQEKATSVERAATACANEVYARKERKKSMGQINWNTNVTPGTKDDVPLDYIEVTSDGDRPGQAWRNCMLGRGIDTAKLDLGDRPVSQGKLPDIN